MAAMSWLYPRNAVNLAGKVFPLKADIPFMEEWSFIHTPGHSPGHISLFRERDGVLIAGDAFVTTNQNSLMSVIKQRKEVHAPPAYFTINWEESKQSITALTLLNPTVAGTGHGLPVFENKLHQELRSLLDRFEETEVPKNGYYTTHPVKAEEDLSVAPVPAAYKKYVVFGALSVLALLAIAFYPRK